MILQKLEQIQQLLEEGENPSDTVLKFIKDENSIILEYYLLGNLLRKIDSMRNADGNKSSIFENFITGLTPRNLKKMVASEIMQRQIHFIKRLKPKSKIIFDIIANRSQHIFDMSNFDDAIIGMTTGYFADKRIL